MAKKTNFLLCGLSCLVLVVRTYNDPCVSHPCPAKSYCVSKEQKYFCYCIDGYASNTGERNFKDRNVVCREIDIVNCSNFSSDATFQNCQKQLNLSSSMDNSREICTGFAKLSRSCGERRTTLSLQDIGNSYHFLTNLTSQITPGNQKQKARLVTTYLQSIEAAVLATASRNPKETQKEEGPFMAINTQRVENCSLKTLSLKAEKQTMDIHCSTTEKEILGGIVAFISYASIGSIIGESFASEENLRTKEKLHNFYLNSKVVSGTVGSRKNISLPVSVNFTFQHEKMKRENEQSICVYWQGSSWSNEGCQVISSDENQTLCSCNHLSSFAILVATAKLKVDPVLTMITYVGLSLSLLCLFLAALTFLLCRTIQNISTSLHLQLSICLFLAHLLFLTGIERTKSKVLCSIIAGVLHYLYLASFTWMLLEGLQLFLTVKNLKVANYISAGKFKRRFIYPFGYGIPAVIVAVSAGLEHTSYGTETHCWLNFHGRFIWSFMGPVFVIILINFSFYLTTLCILKNQLSSLNNELSRMHNTRMLAFKAIAQLFILGCSWGLGFFLVEGVLDPIRSVMAYSFTIINVLQGVYIYLVYCLLNHKVREEYRRWFKKMRERTETGNYDFFGSVTQTKTVENTVDFPGKSSNISS
ncbi:adhesion G protein-coupled receptor E3-like isoform X1 [Mustela putorius furo]|uniref:Adhesion G protein-coupled receptor E3-like isoform X1 n=3 Tax=Mustela putorius furo TaxID=9669 RepID=A0A8U0SEM2_MUSPF|nr:adhesion G protein-coupled receptor E3-like isoform X1 [Mustela putorius furo]